ncbi:MAG: hypothetical protein AB7S88_04635 [Candidatus Izemoplasmatales bacterium]
MIQIIAHPKGLEECVVTTPKGVLFSFLNVGATWLKWQLKDGTDLVARYLEMDQYRKPGMYLGTTVGPNAGRIENAIFSLNGVRYEMGTSPANFLHSGKYGISFQPFELVEHLEVNGVATLKYHLEVEETGFPGKRSYDITYVVSNDGVKIYFDATSDELTLCNLTNHAYFNLEGDFSGNAAYHQLQVNASCVVMVNDEFIGKTIVPIQESVLDFSQGANVVGMASQPLLDQHEVKGVDHYFIFDSSLSKRAILSSMRSGRQLTMETDYPGVTVYSTNYPNDTLIQTGEVLGFRSCVCLEASYASNAINDSRLEAGLCGPDRPYHHWISFTLEEPR